VQSTGQASAGLVEVAYACTACHLSYSHPTTVAQAGLIMGRPPLTIDVLQVGGVYFHCGAPLLTVEFGQRSIYAPLSTEQPRENEPQDVSLRARLLRCCCGFQMEIPD
jgi:hypothetical protein